ncbi:MAG: TonB-dependent receptor, partial [candidate division WOR-3 bacterium]
MSLGRPALRSLIFMAALEFALAGETGRIAGRVCDSSGEPLCQVSVFIEELRLGTATDVTGHWTILNVPAGTYSVHASMVGYRPVVVQDVRVEPDRTARVDFRLEPAVIEMPRVVVRAERPLVSKEMVAARYAIPASEIAFRPGDVLTEVVMLAPGVARTDSQFHVRGGRATEVDYLIDGVTVVDPLDGGLAIELARGVADEIVFMPGGFSAEYGRAMSGVINMVTVNPGSRLGAGVRLKSEKPMPFYYDFGYNDQGVQLHLPLLANLRLFSNLGVTTTEDWDPRLFKLPHKARADYSLYGKCLYDITSQLKLAISGIAFRSQLDRYKSQWRLILDNYRSDLRKSSLGVARLTYMPTAQAFYTLTLSRLGTEKSHGVRIPGKMSLTEDIRFREIGEYSVPVMDINNPWGCPYEQFWFFYTGGTYEEFRQSSVQTTTAKLTANNQVNPNHQLIAGLSWDWHQVRTDWVRWPAWNPVIDTYRFAPTAFAGYLQDRIDYEGLYCDIGFRYDRFWPNGVSPDSQKSVPPKSRFSPRLGMSFRITPWLFMRANYGHYFQVPLFSMLYDNTVNPVYYRTQIGGEPLIVGNPDLEPERTQSYEIGFQGEVARNLTLTMNLWRKDVYGLVGTRTVPALPQSYVTYTNIDYARLTGLEVIGDVRAGSVSAKLAYSLSFARGTSSYANQAYYEFILQGDTAPMVEYTLDFDQRHRFFAQLDLNFGHWAKGRVGRLLLDSAAFHLIGYLGTGFPYTPPGGKGDPATWNTRLKPWRSNLDAVITKGLRVAGLRLSLLIEVLNILDIRDIMNVYPATGKANDDGITIDCSEFWRPAERAMRFGDPGYDPRRDLNKDGYCTQFEDYRSVYLYHRATVDWVNN